MTKKILPILIAIPVLFVIGVILLFVFERWAPYSGPQEKIGVRLKWLHQTQFAGMYVADKKGFYEKKGIDIKLKPFDEEHIPIDEVLLGESTFGVAGADEILIARAEGKNVVALAAIYQDSPAVAYAKKTSGIKEPKDFIGKKVGIEPSINVELGVRAMLTAEGLDYENDIQKVEIGYDAEALIEDEVDVASGYITNEPLQAEEAGHPVNIISPKEYGVDLYGDVLFTTEETIRENPDLVKRFVDATLEGWNYALKNQEEAVRYTLLYKDSNNEASNYDHQKLLLDRSYKYIKPNLGTPVGQMNHARWKEMHDTLRIYGILTKDVNISEAYTTEFLNTIFNPI